MKHDVFVVVVVTVRRNDSARLQLAKLMESAVGSPNKRLIRCWFRFALDTKQTTSIYCWWKIV